MLDLNSYTFYTYITSYTTMNVCIKGIKPETWRYLKSEAAKEDKNMGEFIDIMAIRDKERSKGNWSEIKAWKPIFTKEEAEELRANSEGFRNEFTFKR